MKSTGITVNNVDLSYYLEKKEQQETEETFKQNCYKPGVHKNTKPKYQDYKEPNGKVRILGQREKNIAVFETELAPYLSLKKTKQIVTIFLLCFPDSKKISIRDTASYCLEYAKKHNIIISRNINYSLRIAAGALKNSELGDYLHMTPKKHNSPTYYYLSEEAHDTLTLTEAIEKAMTRKPKPLKDQTETRDDQTEIVKTETVKTETQDDQTEIQNDSNILQEKIYTQIVQTLNRITQEKGIYITGNINVYINTIPKNQI